LIVTADWLSLAVEKVSFFSVGIVVLRAHTAPHTSAGNQPPG
jgi:hypothetical protein